ncbi:MAG: GrpB family protein [Ignavibacteria bacterium]|nr:GrpB family protein [Ignavibacteria bacterium]
MKIILEKYNPEWTDIFSRLKEEIISCTGFLNPVIEHIGSTSVYGLTSKPVIDILAGVRDESDIDKTISPLVKNGFIYYEKYNSVMPYRRYFVKLKKLPDDFNMPEIIRDSDIVPPKINIYKLAHIHVMKHNSFHWIRHIAFRDYLRKNEEARDEYENLKLNLCEQEWKSGSEFSAAKSDFISKTEKASFELYRKNYPE